MKLHLKAVAAAVGALMSASAFAAIDNFASGNGELFFTVHDPVANQSFVFDLTPKTGFGTLNLNDVLPNYYTGSATFRSNLTTPAIGGATPGAASSFESTKLTWNINAAELGPDWTSFVGASNPNNWRWAVVGGDSTVPAGSTTTLNHALRYVFTSPNALTGAGTSQVDDVALSPGLQTTMPGRDASWINPLNARNVGGLADFADNTTDGTFTALNWGSAFQETWGGAVAAGVAANLGSSMNFYYITGRAASTAAAAQYGNSSFGTGNFGKWTFFDDPTTPPGDYMLMWNDQLPVEPIPEPGTWALMLAGLLGLGAVARRRARQ